MWIVISVARQCISNVVSRSFLLFTCLQEQTQLMRGIANKLDCSHAYLKCYKVSYPSAIMNLRMKAFYHVFLITRYLSHWLVITLLVSVCLSTRLLSQCSLHCDNTLHRRLEPKSKIELVGIKIRLPLPLFSTLFSPVIQVQWEVQRMLLGCCYAPNVENVETQSLLAVNPNWVSVYLHW